MNTKELELKLKTAEEQSGAKEICDYKEKKLNIAKMECLLGKDLISYPYSLWKYYGL